MSEKLWAVRLTEEVGEVKTVTEFAEYSDYERYIGGVGPPCKVILDPEHFLKEGKL